MAVKGPDRSRQDLVGEVAAEVMRQLRARALDSAPWPPTDDELVFVACSLDPDMDPVYDAVACAATSVGLRTVRIKDFQRDYRITDKILILVQGARLVVADLSHDEPNVYFALGYAFGLGKNVITTLKTGAIPHFDVHNLPCLEYMDSRPLERRLRERFRLELKSPPPQVPD